MIFFFMQASLYGQIIRWFQNHSEKSSSSKKGKRPSSSGSKSVADDDDDEEAVQYHLQELKKEASRKKGDSNKITRLLSLTFNFRRREALSLPAGTRVNTVIRSYPCLLKPIHVSFGKRSIIWWVVVIIRFPSVLITVNSP